MTETEKAKFQTPFTYNDERNFVKQNSVKKISDDLVYLTKDTSSASILSELEEREEITEDVPAPADIPAPAPADTLETVEEQPYIPGSRKSQGRTLEGQPVHLVTFTWKCSRQYLNLDQQITSTKLNFRMCSRAEDTRA